MRAVVQCRDGVWKARSYVVYIKGMFILETFFSQLYHRFGHYKRLIIPQNPQWSNTGGIEDS